MLNSQLPLISIVTPTYNQGKYIEQTILSVLDQNYPNLEYIIIDGGSSDETVNIIKKYEQRISYWVSEPDTGQTDAINKGFAKCTGDIFNWINSDDFYEPGTFYKISQLFSNDPAVNVICGRELGFNDANPTEKILHHGSVIKENVFETIRIGIIDQPCTFFRKNRIAQFFPLDTSLRYVMDRQLWWCYLLRYGQKEILQTEEVFTHFRLHSQSKTVSEAGLVEKEFDRLKWSLFELLDAPEILKIQLEMTTPLLTPKWNVSIEPKNFILAAFATFYAERNYVNDKLAVTSGLMRLVKKWKGIRLTKKEWKLWFFSTVIPKSILIYLKEVKHFLR